MKNYGHALQQAISLVMVTFGDQTRIGPEKVPSYTHPVRVGLTLAQYGFDHGISIAGVLHDSVEDTNVTLALIEKLFGSRVRFMVQTSSFDHRIGDNPEGEAEMYERVLKAAEKGEPGPLAIKCVDSNDNLKTCKYLKREYQISMVSRGINLLDAGNKYFGKHEMLDDLSITLARQKNRLAG